MAQTWDTRNGLETEVWRHGGKAIRSRWTII